MAEASRRGMLTPILATLLVGGCASTLTDVGAGGASCRELVVEVDRTLPTRRGRVENRSEVTRLSVDAQDVPHVTWTSHWSRFTPMGQWHHELHRARLAGRRWIVQHGPIPPDFSEVADLVDPDAPWTPGPHEPRTTQPPDDWRWPEGVARGASLASFAVAARDGRSVVVAVAWRPRGPASARTDPHGGPYTHDRDPRRGRGTMVVSVTDGAGSEPRIIKSVRLRRDLHPLVELGPGGTIHVLLLDWYISDFEPNRYVQLRCRP